MKTGLMDIDNNEDRVRKETLMVILGGNTGGKAEGNS